MNQELIKSSAKLMAQVHVQEREQTDTGYSVYPTCHNRNKINNEHDTR